MTDIVERLRSWKARPIAEANKINIAIRNEAADEIERLRMRCDGAEGALSEELEEIPRRRKAAFKEAAEIVRAHRLPSGSSVVTGPVNTVLENAATEIEAQAND